MNTSFDFAKQIKVIGQENQKKLENKKVLVIGIGALGTVVSDLLARAGMQLLLADFDIVDRSNLPRQILFDQNDINKPKAETAFNKLKGLNNKIKFYNEKVDSLFLNRIFLKENFNIIVDCTDNLQTRFIIDDFCQGKNIPFVYGAVVGSKGMLFNVIPRKTSFRNIFNHVEKGEVCSEEGILNSVSATIASLQAGECIKILLEQNYCKDLIYFNLSTNTFNYIKINKSVRNVNEINLKYSSKTEKEIKEKYISEIIVRPCKTKASYIANHKSLKPNLQVLKEKYEVVMDAGILIVLKTKGGEVIVQKYGELLFKTCTDEKLIKEVATDIFLS